MTFSSESLTQRTYPTPLPLDRYPVGGGPLKLPEQ